MGEVARSHARGRWARPLALCALVPLVPLFAHAQVPSCTPSAALRFPSQYSVAPTSVRAVGRSLLVIGAPAYRFETGPDGALVVADTMVAGLLLSPSGSSRAIMRPASARAFVHPRIVPRSRHRTDVVWSEPDFGTGGGNGASPYLLRAGTLVDGTWSDIKALGRFDLNSELSREVGSDLVTVAGVSYMAFPDEVPLTGERRIIVLSDSGGTWSTSVLRFDLSTTGATELGDDSGVLVAIFLGMPNGRPVERLSRTSTVWLARRERDGWTEATQVGGDEIVSIQYPTLVRRGRSLIAAWISYTDVPALEWREVTGGAAPGPIQRIDGVAKLTQGQAPFRDVLSLIATDGSARVVRLRPDGFDVLAQMQLLLPLGPVVAGTLERPWGLTFEMIEKPDPGPYRVVAHDFRCALRR